MPDFESVQECEVIANVAVPFACSVFVTLKTTFSRYFGALTWIVQCATLPLGSAGSAHATFSTAAPVMFFFSHAVNAVFS